jgi:membrane protease YdiL (CAAX protease family)
MIERRSDPDASSVRVAVPQLSLFSLLPSVFVFPSSEGDLGNRVLNLETRNGFLNAAGLVQGGLLVAALLLVKWFEVPLADQLYWSWRDCGWGLLGTLPMLVVLMCAGKLRRLVGDLLGRPLSLCTWYDLAAVAALAGIGEELWFRGLATMWISGLLNPWAGVILANLLFAFLHALTPTYAVVAAAFGFYLSWLAIWPGEPNLLRPIVTHSVYDFIAFLWIVREYRSRATVPTSDPRPPTSDL